MPKTIQQAEQEALTALRAWVLADKKFMTACAEERAAGRWTAGPEVEGLSDNWKAVCREAGAATEAMRSTAYDLSEIDAANSIAKVGADPQYRYGPGAPCVDEIERDASAAEVG